MVDQQLSELVDRRIALMNAFRKGSVASQPSYSMAIRSSSDAIADRVAVLWPVARKAVTPRVFRPVLPARPVVLSARAQRKSDRNAARRLGRFDA